MSGATGDSYTPVAGDAGSYLRVTASYIDGEGSGKTADAESANPVVAEAPANSNPAFSAETASREVTENTPANRNLGAQVTATDDDNDTLHYTLGGDDASAFDIVSTSGQLRTKDPLDYETNDSYSVTVAVSDGKDADGNADTAADDTITVTITVTDVEEAPRERTPQSTFSPNPPVKFNQRPAFNEGDDAERSVTENVAEATNIGQPIKAVDADKDQLTYTLGGSDAASFDIVGASGQVQAKAALDYESKDSYTVTVKATDSSNASDTITVTITVTDVEEAPEFPASETDARSVAENTAAGENIGDPVAAEDDDGDALSYTLGGTDATSFTIVETSGQLQTKAALDYETKSSYSVTVAVSDGKDADGNADTAADDTITVTITVTDVEEAPRERTPQSTFSPNPPVKFNQRPAFNEGDDAERSVTENVAEATNIGQPIKAVDADKDQLTYTLGGSDAASFDIVGASGQVQAKAALDYESKDSYTVTVKATDSSNASDTITVTITVTDVEEAPEFPASETDARSVAENTAAGENIGDPVAAEDDDGDALSYTLGGTDATSFTIVETSGQLQTKAALDYETKSSYSVTVAVSDGKDADGNADTAADDTTITVTITVTNVEEAPEFPASETDARSVAENTAAGENIGDPVAAEDDDGDALSYTLGGTDATSFTIVETSGQLQTKAALDYETKSSYSVTVAVSDGKDADGNADTAADDTITVTITVTDVEEAPEFPASETDARSVAENTAAGENIGDPVAAEDDDGDALSYTLGGTDATSFTIVETSGQLQTKAALDYETKSSYSVTVAVSDGKDADGNADTAADDTTITVTITVTNVEEAPEFPASETDARSVAENTAAGENIGDPVAAEDDDGDALSYTLGGTDATSFTIVETSGQLQTKAALDYETKSSYSVTVAVSDGKDADGNADTAADDTTITVTITVTNVEEAPEFPASETDARSVAENTAAGENIGDPVAAEDDDGDALSYTLGGTDATSFTIVETSGQLQTKAALDYETKSSYSVTVAVSDGKDADGNADTAADDTTITIADVEEEGTVALSSVQPQADSPLIATLTDPDGGVSGTTWEWETSADKSNWETISGTTGASYTPASDDVGNYLRATASYTDRRGSSKAAQVASDNAVRAAPVTNSAPEFAADSLSRKVAENTEAGENIGDPVVAADEDDDPLTYALGGSDASSFDIVALTGQLLTKASLDFEAKSSYTVTVTATDPSAASDSIIVSITVTDVAGDFVAPGAGDDQIGASIIPFTTGGDVPLFVAGNARASDAQESPASLPAVIMMIVGTLMIAAGIYLKKWASRPQRRRYRGDKGGFAFPGFAPAPAD